MKILNFLSKTTFFKCCFFVCYIIGRAFLKFIIGVGRVSIFSYKTFLSLFHKRFFLNNLIESMYTNGFCSIPLIGFTGVFIGAVLTLQLFISMSGFGLNDNIPNIVLIALTKEMAPVICCLMVVSRVGSSMSSEIAGMACNNQLDVLMSMSISKYRFLYIPRILSMIIFQPILTTIGVITGMIGCLFITSFFYDYTSLYFFNLLYENFKIHDYMVGVIKGLVFGFVLSTIACYKGDKAIDGAVGIKKATISSVVSSCIIVLILNFIITFLFD